MARLRVGVSEALVEADPSSGHGRVWSSTLAELGELVHLVPVHLERGPGDYRPGSGGFDVWLANGHAGRADVRVPVVAAVHEMGWTPDQLRGLDDSGFSQPLASRTAAGVASAAHVIAPSDSSRRQVIDRSGMAPERVHLVPYGVDATVFHPDAAGGRSLVARHAGTDERPYLLFVGSLLPRKNVFPLREAVRRLARRGYPHALAIVTGDPGGQLPSERSEEVAADLPDAPGRVVMIPHPTDPELASLMAGAEAFCLPSLGEGFGLPALEAMACGTVVVVSDRGALPEVVGDAGLVVPPTADALEEALRGVLDRPEDFDSLRQRGVARARGLGWDRTARGWARVLAGAADESSPGGRFRKIRRWSKRRRIFRPNRVERRFLARLELDGATVVDVGARHGAMTLLFAKAVGPAGRVIAYEPHPTACERLRRKVARTHNVAVRQVALADAPGELAFAYPPRRAERGLGSAHPGVRDELLSRGAERTTFAATTLDAEVAAGHAPPPALVKIDVEGLELAVIRGMEQTLAQHSPDLHIELHGYDAVAGECELLLDALETHGYRARHVETGRPVTTRSVQDAIPGHIYAQS